MLPERDGRIRWALALACPLFFCASLAPVRAHDYFWHLATGRWIVEHHALPAVDPFGIASARTEWIDGEWLFQVLLYGTYAAGGHVAVSAALAAGTALLFTMLLAETARRKGLEVALPIVVFSWYATEAWFRERPATLGTVCAALVIFALQRLRGRRRRVALVLTTIVWMNLHPSAIVAPLIVAAFELGEVLRSGERDLRSLARRALSVLVVFGALFVTRYGIRGVLAPLRLTALMQGGEFGNGEWAASGLVEFPLLYAALVAVLVLWWTSEDRSRHLSDLLVFLLLAALAIRFCRNQGLFFCALPLLVAGLIPPTPARVRRIAAVAALATFFSVLAAAWWQTGIDERVFPVAAVARLRASGLAGNIYTEYGLGGFLIWNFYPERRVVTDGRNELYVAYNREAVEAEGSHRAWRALIRKYGLTLAVFPYQSPPVRFVDGQTGQVRTLPRHAVFFPKEEWALVAIDPVGMVFARRDAYPAARLAALEVR